LKPPPGRDIGRTKQSVDPEIIDCPKCGEEIRIKSSKRPVKVTCSGCGSKVKVLGMDEQFNSKKMKLTSGPDEINCPKCGQAISINSPDRPIRLTCRKCRAKIKILD
jgi:DNA-directed RNA polymerase subunit M/transcription elongation factor TFIIS